MSRLRLVRDDYHGETYLVNEFGQEVCEHCSGPYVPGSGWAHEDSCDLDEEPLTPNHTYPYNPTTVTDLSDG